MNNEYEMQNYWKQGKSITTHQAFNRLELAINELIRSFKETFKRLRYPS